MHMHIHISTQFVFSLAFTEMFVSACIYHCIDFKPITIFLIYVTAMAGQCTNARSTDCTLGTCSVVFVNAGIPRLSMTCSLRRTYSCSMVTITSYALGLWVSLETANECGITLVYLLDYGRTSNKH